LDTDANLAVVKYHVKRQRLEKIEF
jgi:hypothetical protein